MLVSLLIVGLYLWSFSFERAAIELTELVSPISAMIAGIVFCLSLAIYIYAPKEYIKPAAIGVYALLTFMICLLIFSTGGLSSPFVALWMLVAIFSGVFGWYGIAAFLLLINGYIIWYATTASFSKNTMATLAIVGEIPILLSYLLWNNKKGVIGNDDDTPYNNLASEFSELSGQSEVIINQIADGVVTINGKGHINLINPAAQRILGWTKQDALSLDFGSVIKVYDIKDQLVADIHNPIEQAIQSNNSVTTDDFKLETHSEKKIFVSMSISPAGQPGSGVIVVFRDISKEKAEERQQAEFISTASHEMRTPVASIEGYLGLALNPNTATIDAKARDFIAKAHESAQHLGRLFQDLLDITKAEDGRLATNPQVLDMGEYLQRVAEGLTPQAEAKNLRFIYKPGLNSTEGDDKRSSFNILSSRVLSPVYYVKADPDHLREVASNLMENAIKYTPKGEVVIDITGDHNKVVLSVKDTGIGIPREDVSHLFQKFYRVDNSDTREIGGTGLGLYLCRRLIETMGGRIWVESEYQKGSTFFVELPRLSHEEAMKELDAAVSQEEKDTSQIVMPEQTIPLTASDAMATAPPLPPQQPATRTPTIETPQAPAPHNNTPPPSQQPSQAFGAKKAPYYDPNAPHFNVPLTEIEQNPGQYISYNSPSQSGTANNTQNKT